MTKLKRLKIKRYRDVEPCELVFSDRFNILLGPNGAGKTTLLELISKVLRTNLQEETEPYSLEIELPFSNGILTGTIESTEDTPPSPKQGVARVARSLASSQLPDAQAFFFQIHRTNPASTMDIRPVGDRVTCLPPVHLPDGTSLESSWPRRRFGVPPGGLLRDAIVLSSGLPSGLDEGLLAAVQSASRFDESLDTFRAITARNDVLLADGADLRPHVFHRQTGLRWGEARLVDTSAGGIIPQGMLRLIEGRFDGDTEVSFRHDDLHFLSETVRLIGLGSAIAKLELTAKSVEKSPKADLFEFGNLQFWFTRRDGSIFQHHHLSYGQKRLLAFLYYLDANPCFVIADELVNGLHHAWIDECMKAIGERQAFLTSQNPLLLDYLYFDSVAQVKESFILCRTEPVGDRDKMIWRNMTDDEADMFYRAYKVGVEHVGEILRTRGLW